MFLFQKSLNIFIFRYFKNALAASKNQEEQNLILYQIRDVETQILAFLRAQREIFFNILFYFKKRRISNLHMSSTKPLENNTWLKSNKIL